MTGHLLDHLLREAAERLTRRGPPPAQRLAAPLRREAMNAALVARRARALDVHERAGSKARAELAELANEALAEMRADVREQARRRGGLQHLLVRGDELWRDPDGSELLDDPELDLETRVGIMTDLDAFNERFASYERFLSELLPLARRDGPTRVLDLAAGHGGFALSAARAARDQGLDFRFTASDVKQDYLDLGAATAKREGLPVEFVVQDAFDLGNLETDAYDIIVCTQSLHHFPPGWVSVMFSEAVRAASRGVVFTDGCRSALAGAGGLVYGALRLRNRAWMHDAFVSLRRCYVPEELELLARLAAPGRAIESRWVPPGHCLLATRSVAR